jgi:putative tryptophan/tyrosine transport system substrate-binding protein
MESGFRSAGIRRSQQPSTPARPSTLPSRGPCCLGRIRSRVNRRVFVVGLGAALVAPLGAFAQQPSRTPIVVVIIPGSPESNTGGGNVVAFKNGLSELGYTEGANVRVVTRFLEGRFDSVPGLVNELQGLGTSVIVVVGTTPAQAVTHATRAVPVVFVGASAPVEAGLTSSLGHPGGNATGLSTAHEEGLAEKWVQLLGDAVPKLSTVAILYNPSNPSNIRYWQAIRTAAQKAHVSIKPFEATTVTELDTALARLSPRIAEAAIVTTDPFFFAEQVKIVTAMDRQRMPTIYGFRNFVTDGGLMSYGASLPASYRRAAVYVDKILKGAKPADLPVEQPTTFEFVINMKAAKALGRTIPRSLLLRADQVIE